MPPKRKRKFKMGETPEYERLVDDIKKVIDEAAKQGIDLFKRCDLLTCRHCRAYEDINIEGVQKVYDRKHGLTDSEEFIIIDSRERSYTRGGTNYFKTTYEFICSFCGVQQKAYVRSRFED